MFKPHAGRRIVLATNVAETSLTVPGIRYVVDPGEARIKRYSYRSKVEQLQVEKISQASANQRAGRCGRVASGVCIRLYAEDDFTAAPGLHRARSPALVAGRRDPAHEVACSLGEVEDFPFLDPPLPKAISDGYGLLAELGAVDEANELTETGRQLARLPLDPRIARMILAARAEGSLAEVLIIAAALSLQDPRERPLERAGAADAAQLEVRRRKIRFPRLPQAVEVLSGGARAQEVEPQADGSVPREFSLLPAHARVAGHPRSAACLRRRTRLEGIGQGGELCADPPRAARRPARQHRLQVRGQRALSRRARHQVPDPSGLGRGQESRALDHGGGNHRDHAPVCALRRAHRAGVAGGHRRASDPAPPVRAALGEKARPRRGVRARARCTASCSTPSGASTTVRWTRRNRAGYSSARRWSRANTRRARRFSSTTAS